MREYKVINRKSVERQIKDTVIYGFYLAILTHGLQKQNYRQFNQCNYKTLDLYYPYQLHLIVEG